MDYIITSLLLVLGVCFFVMQKVSALKRKYSEIGFTKIWGLFFSEEWDSLMVSTLVLIVWNIFLTVCEMNQIKFPVWFDYYGIYALALVLGYAGQRLAYKYLTTIEGILEKKAEQLKSDK